MRARRCGDRGAHRVSRLIFQEAILKPVDASRTLFAARALLPDGWRDNVALTWNDAGDLTDVRVATACPPGTRAASGPLIPGMPNLHSHAFQRAMAGLTETLGDPSDSFWSWRTLMYRFAERLQPHHLEAIGRHLYIEMLKAGYTSVCEFHYVHHAVGGRAYANPAEHAERIVAAAQDAGIGLTLLPVLYQYSGFGAAAPLPHQARFIASPDWILDLRARLRRSHPEHGGLRYGVAPHSLRAVSADSLAALLDGLRAEDAAAPVHIHIAEQIKEVEDCIAAYGRRPVEYLMERQALDARWCLVHATHMTPAEYGAVAHSGAVVGLCPTTEANLGDGIFDAAAYLAQNGRWGIGSDSNVSVDPRAELRLLEYGQRLTRRRRNVLADPAAPAVADRLYRAALDGGAAVSGRRVAGLAVGQRADFVVLDGEDPNLAERAAPQLLSALVFCEHGGNPVRDVFVGGRAVIEDGRHRTEQAARQDYRKVLAELLA
jgi:formimidoylglutamate deiminase